MHLFCMKRVDRMLPSFDGAFSLFAPAIWGVSSDYQIGNFDRMRSSKRCDFFICDYADHDSDLIVKLSYIITLAMESQ